LLARKRVFPFAIPMQQNPRHIITPTILQQLPTTLLLTWSTVQFLQLHLNAYSGLSLQDLTIELLLLLLNQIAAEHHITFCGFLACRRCLRQFKEARLNAENQALITYVNCCVFRVRNDGSQECSRKIPNAEVRPFIVISDEKTSSQALTLRGIPIRLPTPTSTPIIDHNQQAQNPAEVVCRTNPRPTYGRRRRRSPDRVEGIPNDRSNMGAGLEHRVPSSSACFFQFAEGSFPNITSYWRPLTTSPSTSSSTTNTLLPTPPGIHHYNSNNTSTSCEEKEARGSGSQPSPPIPRAPSPEQAQVAKESANDCSDRDEDDGYVTE
jgi:hypothetical protein